MEPLLRAADLVQSLGALPVIRGVSFEILPGEVVGLAGESGAGKSALAMLLAGIHAPERGELYLSGERLHWPFRARALGIELIQQQPEMAESLDISSNVFLGSELGWPPSPAWWKIPNRRRMDGEATRILSQLGMRYTSLREPAANLSGEQRQLVAIARAMTRPARLIIVDEAGLLLSYPFQQRLLRLVQEWQKQGSAVLYATDDIDQLMAITDRVIVLRHGRLVAEHRTDETQREDILAAMMGAVDQQQLTPIIWALDTYYRAREQAQRLRQRQLLLERELEAQEPLDSKLIDHMADQIDALDRANVSLQDAQRRLLAELEQERKRLAREIHDQVIQDLLAVSYRLDEMAAGVSVNAALRDELEDVRGSVRELVSDLRHICGTLRPPTIDSLGIGSALQSYAHEWSRRTGTLVTLALDANLGRLPEATELSIFRIVQEGLRNVGKHAAAGHVEVRLEHISPRRLMLTIADDGRGLADDFDLSKLSAEGHYGVLGITERVALIGGHWRFQNKPEGGAVIQVEIPHPRSDANGAPD